jgi:subtilisin family serine protease
VRGPFFSPASPFIDYNVGMIRFVLLLLLQSLAGYGATIAIIDTGFDLDHEYLKPKVLQKDSSEAIDFQGHDFFDNSHLKRRVIEDQSSLQEILLYRNLRAKGHNQGLSLEEFEWFKKKSADKSFMEKVRLFKKHSHGTFVAGIALREGENINIFPIRGLALPTPVVAVEDTTSEGSTPLLGKTPEERFEEEMKNSISRVSKKFSKICHFVAQKGIEVVNASYGITYKNITLKFRERYKEFTGKEINELKLKTYVDNYFSTLYQRAERTMRRHPRVLFVFSAGNSGIDNDLYHHYPSRVRVPNAITVAALNGEYLATFSNYGRSRVDIGAPGVGILSLVPKVYSTDGTDVYSPSSGTSMAAPYISNLAAQILNTNSKLSPEEIKRIIMETGDVKEHLKTKLVSGAAANNHKSLKAALLSRDMKLEEAIGLANSNLIPMEDKISIGIAPAISPEEMKKKVLESFPSVIPPKDTDDPTSEPSSLPTDQEKGPQDTSGPLPSEAPSAQEKSADQVPSNQNEEQSPPPSEERPASSSRSESSLPEAQSPAPAPSSPQ